MRIRALFVLALAILALGPGAALAQDITGPIGPGGLLYDSPSVINASGQVPTAQNLFSKTMSQSLLATQPGHLSLMGYIATANSSPGTLTITCSYGGISVTPVSAVTPTAQLLNVPIFVDFYVGQLASGSTSKAVYATVSIVQSGTTVTQYNARATGTITSGVNTQTMLCTATFSNTSTSTGIIIERAALNIGN